MTDLHNVPIVDTSVIASLKELGGEDDPGLFVEVVDMFLEDAEKHVDNLRTALASGDIKLLERTAHTLKSSSANVGAMRFSKLCFEIEQRGRSSQIDGVQALVEQAVRHYAEARLALEAQKA